MARASLRKFETLRTTVTLPANLVERSQRLINKGIVPSRNALVVAALEHFLLELERQEIDQQFAATNGDKEYQELNIRMSEEFADSDWEALHASEEGQE